MLLRIDADSGVPIYHQITQQIQQAVSAGTIRPGDRLPTVRELATELIINPNTVARAYQDLERAGVVETRRSQGTFACAPSRMLTEDERRARIVPHLDRALQEARTLGLDFEDVRALLSERADRLGDGLTRTDDRLTPR